MKRYNNNPREITAKFNSKCAETGKEIIKGEICIFFPSDKQVFHTDSKQAYNYYNWRADISMGYDY